MGHKEAAVGRPGNHGSLARAAFASSVPCPHSAHAPASSLTALGERGLVTSAPLPPLRPEAPQAPTTGSEMRHSPSLLCPLCTSSLLGLPTLLLAPVLLLPLGCNRQSTGPATPSSLMRQPGTQSGQLALRLGDRRGLSCFLAVSGCIFWGWGMWTIGLLSQILAKQPTTWVIRPRGDGQVLP